MGRLEDMRIVVAGVGPGMGSAIAARAADEGAAVLAVARSEKTLEAAARALQEVDLPIQVAPADLTDAGQVQRVLDLATERLGGTPNVLVNAAGGWMAAPAHTYDLSVVDAMLRLNLKTVMTTTPIFGAAMAKAGGGAIVNVAAAFGAAFPSTGQAVYNATKAGVRGYTESTAAEFLANGVRVNCVMPGGTSHDFAPGRDPARLRRLGVDRNGAPEDVAAAVLFLASRDAGWITGASLLVDGGASLRR